MRADNKNFFRKTNWLLDKKRDSKFMVTEKDDELDDEIAEICDIRRLAEIESKYRHSW